MQAIRRITTSIGLVALLTALLPLTTVAHERREVGNGQYEMVVGFLDEPAFVGLKNGLDLRVHGLTPSASPATGESAGTEGIPVEGLSGNLQAEVIYGDQSMALPLEPRFGEPGAYRSVFFPMAEGDYTFHIFGEIEGVAIDETFTSGPETFGPVEPVEPLQFPKEDSASGGTGVVAASVVGGGDGDGGIGSLIGNTGLGLVVLASLASYAMLQRRGVLWRH
ncbi:MAG TPA: hypothetical protein VGR08_10680 [Thermomicrobiales bacterium]|nr:hypothetical protein [Thermomicrobiales bacterium]